jgi:DNA-directed RNA polymerase subunit M/transcription elongation factor TFIIS
MFTRQKGKQALSKVLVNQKNIDVIEKFLYLTIDKEYQKQLADKSLKKLSDDPVEDDDDDEILLWQLYKRGIFQIIGDIIEKTKLKPILENIKNDKLLWNHNCYKEKKFELKEHDDFIVTPFEVAEGVLQCGRCKSWRTYSYSKQCRSSDESTSVLAQCMGCNNKWTAN